MSVDLVVGIVLVFFIVLLMIETPVAFALAAAGGVGIVMLGSFGKATSIFTSAPYGTLASYTLAIIPLYMLLGMFAVEGRLAERIYGLAARLLRFLPGGLGVATTMACAGFAAVSGSSMATAASIGKISIGEMRNAGYNAGFAAGIVAIGGTLGIMIPPSVAMVLYGIIAQESIGQLLVAGIIPGVLLALSYAVFVVIRSRTLVVASDRSLEEVVEEAAGAHSTAARAAKAKGTTAAQIRAAIWLAAIMASILLGIFTGFITVIESAAIGAFVALLMLLSENARTGLKEIWRRFRAGLEETGSLSSMAFMLLIGASIFSTFLVMSRLPHRLASAVADLPVPPILVVIVILLLLIPLGMFLETMSILIVIVPLVHPIITALGFDGVWFAVLFVIMLEIGMVTPPVGLNVFVVSSSANVPLEQAFRGVLPFLIPSFVVIALIMVFPPLALWLPSVAVG